ncbi:MAG: hypothetical protein KZQ77_01540, partial [Candidatus Thiodiazotropha sp. (ex Notomyrtea botanica)]|nr:hypothetical protein [Candidatus Thiodiazotropha sp. (ex Notomyrtea botanica)]
WTIIINAVLAVVGDFMVCPGSSADSVFKHTLDQSRFMSMVIPLARATMQDKGMLTALNSIYFACRVIRTSLHVYKDNLHASAN